MNNLHLNVGLNVGKTEPKTQLSKTMHDLTYLGAIIDLKLVDGVYQPTKDDEPIKERTISIKIENPSLGAEDVHEMLERLAERLNQDSIAYINNGNARIAFSASYKGEKYEFNPEFFKAW